MLRNLFGRRKLSRKNRGQKRSRTDLGNLMASKSLEEMRVTSPEVMKDNGDGSISLFDAVVNGFQEEALHLLELGAAVKFIKLHGKSVLHLACEQLNVELIDKILEKCVDVNIKDKNGNNALHIIAKTDLGDRFRNTYRVCRPKVEAVALKLLSKGVDQSAWDIFGETPLHCACERQNEDMVKILINHGSDPNAINKDGYTALLVVVEKSIRLSGSSDEIVQLLLENGANVHAKDKLGRTALHYIVDTDNVSFRVIFTELLIWGGSLFSLDENGERLLNKLIFPEKDQSYKKLQKALVEYIIALQCANLDCSEYNIVESVLPFENFISPNLAKHQIKKMKNIKSDSHSLYDVFGNYRDPMFVLDKDLENAVKEASFPLDILDYGSLLKAKFVSAQKRYRMMVEAHNRLTNELPNEIVWKILTFLRDEDLESLTKAVGC